MGFKFRYEALLSYREHLREKAEIAFAAAQKQLRENRELMEEYRNSLTETDRVLESGLRNRISSGHIQNCSSYMASVRLRMEYLSIEIAGSEKNAAAKMKNLISAAKDCNVIKKLKERDQEKWRQNQNILERNEMNETALLRHGKEFL